MTRVELNDFNIFASLKYFGGYTEFGGNPISPIISKLKIDTILSEVTPTFNLPV